MPPAGSTDSDETYTLTTEAYQITVDDGRETFAALSIEREDSDTAWLMSDTVRSLEAMR